MGELVIGRPALQVGAAVSLPLDLVSVMSLLYRAVPGSGLDSWLVDTRRALSPQLQADLDLLHGFSGRLLYYMEEPVMRFEPLREDRLDAGFSDLAAFLDALPAGVYRDLAISAIDRVHQDLGTGLVAPSDDGDNAWRRYIEPALTTAGADEVLGLLFDADDLKARTVRLVTGIWESAYRDDFTAQHEQLREAARIAQDAASRGFGMAFAELTGNRLPATLAASLNHVVAVTFCPSAHLGTFVSYIIYPPHIVVFFGTVHALGPQSVAESPGISRNGIGNANAAQAPGTLASDDLLENLRALGDANRLRILDLLRGGELYAQQIVGRLGIAQSAVSRHLAQLERSGLIRVEPRRGMKYYAVDCERLEELAAAIQERAR
ncbi:MAG: winged helix-turn-helix transcriptional regulator [Chloroflexia bacterium]|nr:winged helix-turn-helix transcriptional regulator [Chloroflexia bacterium]